MSASVPAPAIVVENLGLAFPARGHGAPSVIFENFDLEVARGEFVAVVGRSGVGKSTLLRILAGLARPSQGRFEIDVDARAAMRPTGLVFQDSRLLPWRRIAANVALGLEGLGLARPECHRRALAALARVGLAAHADKWPHQLSGGQRQRVALARALAVEPALLLMDEPFGALDALTRRTLQDELREVATATGKTVIFVTHDVEEAVYLADRVVVLAGSPARIAGVHRIDLPSPRSREAAAQSALVQAIHAALDGVPAPASAT
jgi:NitT/TauT family transport system ATP-binding protein